MQEEKPLLKLDADADADAERPSRNSIYMDMSSGMLQQIKNIDLEASYGTKIDTLARHLKWLRLHDPGAKSIVFSQYKHFLGVLGSAFSRFNIGCISVDHKDGIERFKSDPAVSCACYRDLPSWSLADDLVMLTDFSLGRLNVSCYTPKPTLQDSISSMPHTSSCASR